jgi:hypothetical protein
MKTRRRQTILFRPENLRRQNSRLNALQTERALIVAGARVSVSHSRCRCLIFATQCECPLLGEERKHMLVPSFSGFNPIGTFRNVRACLYSNAPNTQGCHSC